MVIGNRRLTPKHRRPPPRVAWILLVTGFVALEVLRPTALRAQVDTVRVEDLRERLQGDSPYATPALRAFVARAAEANRLLPDLLDSYLARVESEISILQMEGSGREVVYQVEQVASEVLWRRAEPPVQQVVGYRSRSSGLIPSLLTMFEVPWVVPTLYGDRLDLLQWSAPRTDEEGRVLRRRAVHPLGEDREDVYRFSGGDTVLVLHLPGRTLPLVRVEVEPVRTPDRTTLVFEGYLDVDATRHQIVRMRGRMIRADPHPPPGQRLLDAVFGGATFVDFESSEVDQRFWLPRYQRVEIHAISRLSEGRIVMRVVSRFAFPETTDPGPLAALHPSPPPGGLLLLGGAMEDQDFDGWSTGLGELTREVHALDFRDLVAERTAAAEGPRLRPGARHVSHLFRVNEPEGVFTGMGVTFYPGRAWKEGRVRAHGGWAWSERTARGGVEVSHMAEGSSWEWVARGERQLRSAGDFGFAYGREPGVPPLAVGEGELLYDHWTAGLLARQPRGAGWSWRLEASRARDRGIDALLQADSASDVLPFGTVAEGDYWLGRVSLERNPGALGFGVVPGTALRVDVEGAGGDLEWLRLEAGASTRRIRDDLSVEARVDGGITLSRTPPPQRLFELGRFSGLPGYPARAFSGDRVVLAQGALSYTLPFLRRPWRLGGLYLPAIAPAPTAGLRAGWTDASDEALPVLESLGAETTDGVRTTLDLRLRLFGGGLSFGAARPLEAGGRWRFVWSLGQEL